MGLIDEDGMSFIWGETDLRRFVVWCVSCDHRVVEARKAEETSMCLARFWRCGREVPPLESSPTILVAWGTWVCIGKVSGGWGGCKVQPYNVGRVCSRECWTRRRCGVRGGWLLVATTSAPEQWGFDVRFSSSLVAAYFGEGRVMTGSSHTSYCATTLI